jgi:hypothetical protein
MTPPKEWKTVWILGSGFSKPLGGPILPQLLSQTAFEDAVVRYPNVLREGLTREKTDAVRYLYHYGTRFAQGSVAGTRLPGEFLWEHAEEFLDQMDAAALDEKGPGAQRLLRIVNGRPGNPRRCDLVSELRAAARRVAAIQCTTFALDSDLSSERWRPYKGWVSSLSNADTIITFNYDPVLEKLGKDDGRLHFMVPGPDLKPSERETGLVDVYKLHGSVNWKRDGNKIVPQDDLEFGAKCDPDELAIATPGVSKHADVSKFFQPLWTLAESALMAAHAAVFIGYRFPPSDAYSRERLLGALWRNTRQELSTSIVLGPNVHHQDVVRLAKMLEWTSDSSPTERNDSRPRTFPLFAEDYLTVWKFDPSTRELRGEPKD